MTEILVSPDIQEALRLCLILAPVAIASWEKQRLKKEKTGDPKDPNLEIDHIRPLYKKGLDIAENCQALTRPNHAFKHYLAAQQADNEEDRKKEMGAVRLIVQRSTKEEIDELNRRINNA